MSDRHKARRSNRMALLLIAFSIGTVGVLLGLYAAQIPLGQSGKFLYRYSQLYPIRLMRCWPVAPILAGLGLSGYLLSDLRGGRRQIGLIVGAVMVGLLCGWSWFLPPNPTAQHAMNMISLSQDGAFLDEATTIGSLGDYLRNFDRRIGLSIERLNGTRILSNTPGMTVVAYWMLQTWPSEAIRPGIFERHLISNDTARRDVPIVAAALKFSVVLTALWALSVIPGYLLGRIFLSPLGAGLFALLVTFNPATANFNPGKDPAQLLTINLMLWIWFAGARRQSAAWSAAAGGMLMIGMAVGLIHFWIALAAVVATGWLEYCGRKTLWPMILKQVIPAAIGAGVVVGAVYLAIGWNMPGTFAAVWRRFSGIQGELGFNRGFWLVIGMPLFLLFVGPVLPTLLVLRRRIRRWGEWGFVVFFATAFVMVVIYFVGVSYELPRLWIAFLPLLYLGAMADQPLLHGYHARRALRPVLLLAITGVVISAIYASAMDVRESEYRLSGEHRLFN